MPATPPTGPPLRLIRRSAEQANILVGARAPSYNDPDRHVADILNVILGEGMSSRLFLELREHRALVYDVHSFMSRLSDSGVLGIGLACEPRQAAVALEAAIAELRRLAEEPVERRRADQGAWSTRRVACSSGSRAPRRSASTPGSNSCSRDTSSSPRNSSRGSRRSTQPQVSALAGRLLASGLRAAVVGPFRSETRFEQGDRVMRACQTCAP